MTSTRTKEPDIDPSTADGHRNEVLLVGVLGREPENRELPDGTAVTTFRLSIRAPDPNRTDTVDCVVRQPVLRTKLDARAPGDTLQVEGCLRHRFWRSAGGLMSRYEVEVSKLNPRRRR
jgi:single-strand DNA-binding protein